MNWKTEKVGRFQCNGQTHLSNLIILIVSNFHVVPFERDVNNKLEAWDRLSRRCFWELDVINQVAQICIVKQLDCATALTLAFANRTIGCVNDPVMCAPFFGSFNYIFHSSSYNRYLIKTIYFPIRYWLLAQLRVRKGISSSLTRDSG